MERFSCQPKSIRFWLIGFCFVTALNVFSFLLVYNLKSPSKFRPKLERIFTDVEKVAYHGEELLFPHRSADANYDENQTVVLDNPLRRPTSNGREINITAPEQTEMTIPSKEGKTGLRMAKVQDDKQPTAKENKNIFSIGKNESKHFQDSSKALIRTEDMTDEDNITWRDCLRLVLHSKRLLRSNITINPFSPTVREDQKIIMKYSNDKNCKIVQQWLSTIRSSKEEKDFPIAFAILVYKGAQLLEKLLQAIYSPYNLYCIHIDVKAGDIFKEAVQMMTDCLPNVFIAKRSVDVIYWHASTIQAQLNCMEELLSFQIKWKYWINLCGQDFPLYSNLGLVRALKSLNGLNVIQSFLPDEKNQIRTRYIHELVKKEGDAHAKYSLLCTNKTKTNPPFNIAIYKGSSMIVVTREFCKFAVQNQTAREFLIWLNDTAAPDETFYASLQRYPGVPGGIMGDQPKWIARALRWEYNRPYICHGVWIRNVCVLGIGDMSWVFGRNGLTKLFTQKIPFDFRLDMLTCFDLARRKRDEYPACVLGLQGECLFSRVTSVTSRKLFFT